MECLTVLCFLNVLHHVRVCFRFVQLCIGFYCFIEPVFKWQLGEYVWTSLCDVLYEGRWYISIFSWLYLLIVGDFLIWMLLRFEHDVWVVSILFRFRVTLYRYRLKESGAWGVICIFVCYVIWAAEICCCNPSDSMPRVLELCLVVFIRGAVEVCEAVSIKMWFSSVVYTRFTS